MKVSVVFLIILFFSCSSQRNYKEEFKPDFYSYSDEDLNILTVIKYIEHTQENCADTCSISISGIFEYFDDCYLEWDPIYFQELELDLEKKVNVFPETYHISHIGHLHFVKPNMNIDFYFSPALINKKKQRILGQVKNSEGKKVTFILRILGDELYFMTSTQYADDCSIGGIYIDNK